MRIQRLKNNKLWILSSGDFVLYKGKQNPWISTDVLQDALKKKEQLCRNC